MASRFSIKKAQARYFNREYPYSHYILEITLRLSQFIIAETPAIMVEWEDFARTLEPASSKMSTVDLRNHAVQMLQSIAKDLCTRQSLDEQIIKSHGGEPRTTQIFTGEEHGLARLESLFTIEQLVSEYRALRSSVLRLWGVTNNNPTSLDIVDMIRFNEAIDQLLASSVFSFAKATRHATEETARRKDDFLAMLAHELRNPLSPISAAANLLKISNNDAAVINKASSVISRQVAHMATLVDDLLDVSRVTRGVIELKMEPLDLREIINDAVEQVTPKIRARQHILDVMQLPKPLMIDGDKKRLVQVVANLLTNAAKYTPDGGHIWLEFELEKQQTVIIIEDDGIGIDGDFCSKVFDLFAQAKRTSDRSNGGLGLGLTLVKSLVELHSGTVECSSPGLGMGSRFTVRLPKHAHNDIYRREENAFDGELPRKFALKIMVVDDNVDAAETLSMLLQAMGYQVITETEPHRALTVAKTEIPDVFVLDIGLPGMDGNELARQLRSFPETANSFLVALSGYPEVGNKGTSNKTGFDHYLTKPFDIVKFQSVLESTIFK